MNLKRYGTSADCLSPRTRANRLRALRRTLSGGLSPRTRGTKRERSRCLAPQVYPRTCGETTPRCAKRWRYSQVYSHAREGADPSIFHGFRRSAYPLHARGNHP